MVEGVLAGTLLLLIAAAAIGALIHGRETVNLAARRSHAILLAEEGIEAMRNIRDENFSFLLSGTHGLARNAGVWTLNGSSDITGEFTRSISVMDTDANRKNIKATVTWQQNPQRTGEVMLDTIFTNWKSTSALPPSCVAQCQTLGYTAGTCRQNETRCTNNGETHEPLGDPLCTGGPSQDTCCCRP